MNAQRVTRSGVFVALLLVAVVVAGALALAARGGTGTTTAAPGAGSRQQHGDRWARSHAASHAVCRTAVV